MNYKQLQNKNFFCTQVSKHVKTLASKFLLNECVSLFMPTVFINKVYSILLFC